MQTPRSSKPFAASVTALIDRYRFNPFFRSAANVAGLLIAFVFVSLLLFSIAINGVRDAAVDMARETLQIPQLQMDLYALSLRHAADVAYTIAAISLALLSLLFGYLIARFALAPTRASLAFQKQFIGNIAHEIRTPLAVIKTNTEVALFDQKLPQGVRDTFTDTLSELDRISETINNLLSFDTLTRPRRITLERVDLGTLVEGVVQKHRGLADSRGVSLTTDIGEEHFALGNSTALEQVTTNLVKNAINYTPKDQSGSVTVSVGPYEGDRIALTVTDTGIGIARKDLFRIFEPFYRGDTSRARGIGTGTSGLGLAIVNEIVRMHKGSIAIRSTPGQGTEITVMLPKAKEETESKEQSEQVEDGSSAVSMDFR